MQNSKLIAGLVGPTSMAMVASEFPLVQPQLYELQIPPVVYLSGLIFFIAGLAIVRTHNSWVRNWTVLVTISGWFYLVLGLIRMFSASQYQQVSATTPTVAFMLLEGALFVFGLFLTVKAFSSGK